jgi:hypothetical protein
VGQFEGDQIGLAADAKAEENKAILERGRSQMSLPQDIVAGDGVTMPSRPVASGRLPCGFGSALG